MNKEHSKFQEGDVIDFVYKGSDFVTEGTVVDFYYLEHDLALKEKGFNYLVIANTYLGDQTHYEVHEKQVVPKKIDSIVDFLRSLKNNKRGEVINA